MLACKFALVKLWVLDMLMVVVLVVFVALLALIIGVSGCKGCNAFRNFTLEFVTGALCVFNKSARKISIKAAWQAMLLHFGGKDVDIDM